MTVEEAIRRARSSVIGPLPVSYGYVVIWHSPESGRRYEEGKSTWISAITFARETRITSAAMALGHNYLDAAALVRQYPGWDWRRAARDINRRLITRRIASTLKGE